MSLTTKADNRTWIEFVVTIRRVPDVNDDDAIYHPHEQLVHDHDHDHDAP